MQILINTYLFLINLLIYLTYIHTYIYTNTYLVIYNYYKLCSINYVITNLTKLNLSLCLISREKSIRSIYKGIRRQVNITYLIGTILLKGKLEIFIENVRVAFLYPTVV